MVIKFTNHLTLQEINIIRRFETAQSNLGKIAHGPENVQGDEDEGLHLAVELTGRMRGLAVRTPGKSKGQRKPSRGSHSPNTLSLQTKFRRTTPPR
jgi:hypothetical protein